ncbi:MAG TPA: YdcF family protein [Flavobacteriales bacterium]|nr:YdcF family protein [Flavobacteriales bacterium]
MHMSVGLKGRWLRGWRLLLPIALLLIILAWYGRYRILHGLGACLIEDDAPTHADAIYVLGGAPFDRGTYAAELLERDVAPIAYATGSNHSSILKAEGRLVTEAELSCRAAVRAGTPPARILPLTYGTSTFEEAQGVLYHAQRIDADTIVVLTTDFHTRRVGKVFRKRFEGSGIHVLVASAPSTEYDADRWWESEQGLLMVNNELVKSLFYALKY